MMFEQAFKRLFLVLLPFFFIGLAFYLVSMDAKKHHAPLLSKQPFKKCHFLLGLSPFSKSLIKNQKSLNSGTAFTSHSKRLNLKTLTKPFLQGESYFLTKEQILNSIQVAETLPKEKFFFAWPLVLNKEEEWIISQKVFFILPSGERKEISHLSYDEILSFQKEIPEFKSKNSKQFVLSLNTALSYVPKDSSFLFQLLGSDRQKIIKNLDKALSKLKGAIYISSNNERLLNEISQYSFQSEFKILHSYKSLIRLEMLSVLSQSAFFDKQFRGEGLLIPDVFTTINFDTIDFLKQKGKLLFFKKDPPYTKQDRIWIEKSSALIVSQFQEALPYLHEEWGCVPSLLQN